jgi:hypothetical protein
MASKKKAPARERGGFKASRHGAKSAAPAKAAGAKSAGAKAAGAKASAGGNKAEQKKAAENRESKSPKVGTKAQSSFLRGKKIDPRKIDGSETVVQLVDGAFQSYNSGRLREGCQLFTELMLEKNVTVGMTLTGALTPAGLGMSTIIPHSVHYAQMDRDLNALPGDRKQVWINLAEEVQTLLGTAAVPAPAEAR